MRFLLMIIALSCITPSIARGDDAPFLPCENLGDKDHGSILQTIAGNFAGLNIEERLRKKLQPGVVKYLFGELFRDQAETLVDKVRMDSFSLGSVPSEYRVQLAWEYFEERSIDPAPKLLGMLSEISTTNRDRLRTLPADMKTRIINLVNAETVVKTKFRGPDKVLLVRGAAKIPHYELFWRNLADVLNIETWEQAEFTKGDEIREIWSYLEQRDRLGELPPALVFIGYPDLAAILQKP